MENHEKHFEDLHEIRALMERSARFISLSGLSGICAGCFALIGAFLAFQRFDIYPFYYHNAKGDLWFIGKATSDLVKSKDLQFIALVAAGVLLSSLAAGIFFTTRNAKKKGQKMCDGEILSEPLKPVKEICDE